MTTQSVSSGEIVLSSTLNAGDIMNVSAGGKGQRHHGELRGRPERLAAWVAVAGR